MKHQAKIFIYLLIALLFMGGCKKKRDLSGFKPLSKDAVAVVFSSNVEGYVVPCGCTSNPLGGIDRFAQVFEDIKAATNNRVSLFDTGNLLFDAPSRHEADLCQDNARLDLLLSTLGELGLKYTMVAQFDDARGPIYRQNIYKKYGLSPLGQEPQILSIDEVDIALIAIPPAPLPPSFKNALSNLRRQDKIKAVFGISHLTHEETKKSLSGVSGIDVVIQAQLNSPVPPAPKRLGPEGPIVVEGGRQGQYATILILQNLSTPKSQKLGLDDRAFLRSEQLELLTSRLDALKSQKLTAPSSRQDFLSKRIALAEQELVQLEQQKKQHQKPLTGPNLLFHAVALTKKVDALPAVKAKLGAYEKSIPALVAQCEATVQCPITTVGQATYVGVQNCKACHQAAYDVWQKAVFVGVGQDEDGQPFKRQVGHSKAWATLVAAGKDSDRNCIGCHSIGFMKPGGYCKASEVDIRKDVQCEACHGPGSLHAQSGDKRFINRAVSEETCRGCHHMPHIQEFSSFNYDREVMKILGPGHGERLLKELSHKASNSANTQHRNQ